VIELLGSEIHQGWLSKVENYHENKGHALAYYNHSQVSGIQHLAKERTAFRYAAWNQYSMRLDGTAASPPESVNAADNHDSNQTLGRDGDAQDRGQQRVDMGQISHPANMAHIIRHR